MTRPRPARPRPWTALLALAVLASAPWAQVAPSAGPGDPVPGADEQALARNRPLAMINGVPITLAEVTTHARFERESLPDIPTEQLLARSRRLLAEEIVLAAEAERLGVLLDEEAMEAYLVATFGSVPDFEQAAAELGTTPAHLEQLTLRSAMARIYLWHKAGLRHDMSHLVPVDPIMARALSVTPRQLREVYRRDKRALSRPESVRFAAWLGTDRADADAIGASLRAGRPPSTGEYALHHMPTTSLQELLPPTLAGWVANAGAGEVSPSEPLAGSDAGTCMVVHLMERRPAYEPTFAEVQDELRTLIQNDFLERARRQLVAELVGDAVFWPKDLFDVPL